MAKARTKLELRVTELSERIPELLESEKDWVHKTQFDHIGYATKNRVICLDCGETFSTKIISRNKAVCPHCETKLTIEKTRKRNHYQSGIISKAFIIEEFQVIRNYQVYIYHSKGSKASFRMFKVLEYWIDDKDKLTRLGYQRGSSWGVYSWTGEYDIKKLYASYYYHGDKYNLYSLAYLAGSRFKKKYTKIGMNRRNLIDLSFLTAYRCASTESLAETLLKSRNHNLFYINSQGSEVRNNWSTIKILFRHKYKVKDWSMYFDYLDMLNYFKKDLRNPKFICPKDLHKEHNRLMVKKEAIERRKREERYAIQEAEMLAKKKARIKRLSNSNWYQEEKAAFIGLSFTNPKSKRMKMSFLNSPEEVKEDAEELFHCAYSSEYHMKETLLFSGTINEKKMVTIEICLNKMKVLQVRGYGNKTTEYDKDLISFAKFKLPGLVRAYKKFHAKPKKVSKSKLEAA